MKNCVVTWHCKRLNRDIHAETWAILGDNDKWMCECTDKKKIVWTTGQDEYHKPLMVGFRE